jgi:hypothetical protein
MSFFGFGSKKTPVRIFIEKISELIEYMHPRNFSELKQRLSLLKKMVNENKQIIESYEYTNDTKNELKKKMGVVFYFFKQFSKEPMTESKKNTVKELYLTAVRLGIQDLVIDKFYTELTGETPPEENVSGENVSGGNVSGGKLLGEHVSVPNVRPALSSGGSSPIEVNEMLETIITKAKGSGMSPKDYMTSPAGLNIPESEAPRLYDSLECLELINSNNGQTQEGGRKRYKKQTHKKRKGSKRTRRR